MNTTVEQILRTAQRIPWSGTVHRSHRPSQVGDDARFSIFGGGRWNIGQGDPDGRQPFPVLYTATSALVATWERLRHLDGSSVDTMKHGLRMVLSRLEVALASVLDLRSPKDLGISPDVMFGDDWSIPQEIAASAYDEGLNGLLVPTATGLGAADGDFNVVIFHENTGTSTTMYAMMIPDVRPRSGTSISVTSVEEPRLPP